MWPPRYAEEAQPCAVREEESSQSPPLSPQVIGNEWQAIAACWPIVGLTGEVRRTDRDRSTVGLWFLMEITGCPSILWSPSRTSRIECTREFIIRASLHAGDSLDPITSPAKARAYVIRVPVSALRMRELRLLSSSSPAQGCTAKTG